jgi:hypothetical protein
MKQPSAVSSRHMLVSSGRKDPAALPDVAYPLKSVYRASTEAGAECAPLSGSV